MEYDYEDNFLCVEDFFSYSGKRLCEAGRYYRIGFMRTSLWNTSILCCDDGLDHGPYDILDLEDYFYDLKPI